MFIEWTYWLQTLRTHELFAMVAFLLVVDAPRYAAACLGMVAVDAFRDLWRWAHGRRVNDRLTDFCPSVSVVIAGHNEADTIEAALGSIWNTYPSLELIVVDDGSRDGMSQAANRFAARHAGVKVLSRPGRGGKSSALNWGLQQATGEIVVTVDADSQLAHDALWKIVQPFRDKKVGAVSATLQAWNAFTNLATWLQAYEYRQSIFIGRLMQSRLGVLDIVSGAFGAFRRNVLVENLKGWAVGPGEDSDLTLQIRKAGYRIASAPEAVCLTNVPTTWARLWNQRLRWDRSIITLSRKHFRLAYLTHGKFRLSDLWLLVDSWLFNVIAVYAFWGSCLWLLVSLPTSTIQPVIAFYILLLLYACQLVLELANVAALLFYSPCPVRDLLTSAIVPLMPFYRIVLRAVRFVALTDELLFRKSYKDTFVPERVRNATRHW